jgi:hypothetical protein
VVGCGKHPGAQEAADRRNLAATRDLLPEPIGFEEGAGPARRALDATRAARAPRVPRSRPAAAGCGRAARHARATGGSSQAVASAAAAASFVCPLEASLSKARSQAAIRRFAGRPSRCGTGALQEGSGATRRGRRCMCVARSAGARRSSKDRARRVATRVIARHAGERLAATTKRTGNASWLTWLGATRRSERLLGPCVGARHGESTDERRGDDAGSPDGRQQRGVATHDRLRPATTFRSVSPQSAVRPTHLGITTARQGLRGWQRWRPWLPGDHPAESTASRA